VKTVHDLDLEWLRELDRELWEEKWTYRRTGRYAERVLVKNETSRRLTDDEWSRVKRIVGDYRLPVTMASTRFGFGVGMVIYGPEREWLYPGVEEESRPEAVTMISQSHLPRSESTFDGEDKRIKFDDGWRCFEPLTHAERNLEILGRCRIKAPGRKIDYEY
jgi:hypothetical protein